MRIVISSRRAAILVLVVGSFLGAGILAALRGGDVFAAQPFASDPNRRLTIYNGVLQIHSSSGAKVLELGNEIGSADSNIISTGKIFLRPGNGGGASSAGSFFEATVGNDQPAQNLVLSGKLKLIDAGAGGASVGRIEGSGLNLTIDTPAPFYTLFNSGLTSGSVQVGSGNLPVAQFVVRNHGGIGPTGGLATDAIAALANNVTGSAIYAEQGNTADAAWAGYFSGKVLVRPGDLIVGGTRLQGAVAASEICLNDVCRDTWPVGGGNLWTEVAGAPTFTYLTNTASNVYLGGTTLAASKFNFDVTNVRVGINTNAPQSKLVIANGVANPAGSATDAIATYANNASGSAVYAEQSNVNAYAGYFTGRLLAKNGVVAPTVSTGDAAAFYANTTGNAVYAEQQNTAGYGGYFNGRVGIFDGIPQGGTEYGSSFSLGGRSRGGAPEGNAKPWTSFYVLQAEWASRVEGSCIGNTVADTGASNGYYRSYLGLCNGAGTIVGSGDAIPLEPGDYVLVVRVKRSLLLDDGNNAFKMRITTQGGARTFERTITGAMIASDNDWGTVTMRFFQTTRGTVSYGLLPMQNVNFRVDFDFIAIYPLMADSVTGTVGGL